MNWFEALSETHKLAPIAATVVWGAWTAIELGFRRHRVTPSRDWDQGSLLVLNVAHGFRLVGMLVGFLGVGRINDAAPLQLSGLGLMFAGITIRWTAIHALGVLFTGRVQIQEGHTLIRTGLYSRLRHPAYAGSLLAYFGLGLAFGNWWTLACSVLPYVVAIGYRIHVEEGVLRKTFGLAYAQYARTTKRIVPWVY
ncbi:MAG TPA: isoprenylcysteine carboxylmethyltransferase family protein [Vicinamibacterales bacterium]|nr:isoprenylcysteine carboxylmethyltransferase family protein [Vicinamibacterales bacterium]